MIDLEVIRKRAAETTAAVVTRDDVERAAGWMQRTFDAPEPDEASIASLAAEFARLRRRYQAETLEQCIGVLEAKGDSLWAEAINRLKAARS